MARVHEQGTSAARPQDNHQTEPLPKMWHKLLAVGCWAFPLIALIAVFVRRTPSFVRRHAIGFWLTACFGLMLGVAHSYLEGWNRVVDGPLLTMLINAIPWLGNSVFRYETFGGWGFLTVLNGIAALLGYGPYFTRALKRTWGVRVIGWLTVLVALAA